MIAFDCTYSDFGGRVASCLWRPLALRRPRKDQRHDHHAGSRLPSRARSAATRSTSNPSRRATRIRTSSKPKPSFLLKLQKADLLVVVGLQLEIGWLPPLITQSRNAKIQVGAAGYLDVSQYCQILEIPTGAGDARHGRRASAGQPALLAGSGERPAHRQGVRRQVQPRCAAANGAYFAAALRRFRQASRRRREALGRQDGALQGPQGDHLSPLLAELLRTLRPEVVDYVEPKPGIPPSPSHTLELINTMKRDNVKLILVEPYFDLRNAERHRPGHGRQGGWC